MRSKMERWYEDKMGRPGTLDEQVDLVVRYYNEYKKGRDPDEAGHGEEIDDTDILDERPAPKLPPPSRHAPPTQTRTETSGHSFQDKLLAWSAAENVEDVIVIVDSISAAELRQHGSDAPAKFLKDIEEYSSYPDVVSLARKLQHAAAPNAVRVIKTLIKGGIPGKAIKRVDDHTLYVTFPDRYQFRFDTKKQSVQLGRLNGDDFDRERNFKLTERFVADLIGAYKKREKSRIQLGRMARYLAGAYRKKA